MDSFLNFLERTTIRILTHRKALKAYEKAHTVKRTFLGELRGWVDALVFAVFAVLLINQYIFQLFVIPTPSMVATLNVSDRVFVSKTIYGIEIYPGGPKILSKNRQVQRDNIITFYNPEYKSKGPVFDILSQIIYMGTFSLVNIDRNEDGTPAERLYVKRAIGFPGEVIRFSEGNASIRPAGSDSFVKEETFRSSLSLADGPHRSVDSSLYPGIKAWGALFGYQKAGIDINSAPSYLKSQYALVQGDKYPDDFYQFSASSSRTQHLFDPSNFQTRSENASYERGIYIAKGMILPFGDNRDNSRDGRYFGPVSQTKINGSVRSRFWPLNRITYLGNK
ncbi:signal peptidase I [Sphaerochaeta sp.]|uniref:signal peptidase I n=1 Tax=Sphaerochaeta sp. TaxID=1972642 RepID=UPI002FCA3074